HHKRKNGRKHSNEQRGFSRTEALILSGIAGVVAISVIAAIQAGLTTTLAIGATVVAGGVTASLGAWLLVKAIRYLKVLIADYAGRAPPELDAKGYGGPLHGPIQWDYHLYT
ncbi:MAG: hypothetical protein AABZ44_03065, partial [Elusimicrobiota bacterium]